MELKTKYQYSYFVLPYTIQNYKKYILKLTKDKKYSLKTFIAEKDLDIYNYFKPEIRDYIFPMFEMNKEKIDVLKKLEKDKKIKSTILSNLSCAIFTYDLGENVQGKMGKQNGIFFKIEEIEIICFNTGICFLCIKTHLEDSDKFSDILNFNYKFREINSKLSNLKDYENINIQTDIFTDMQEISTLIEEITTKKENRKPFVYSYTCIDSEDWNSEDDFVKIQNEFLKNAYILPSSYSVDFNKKDKSIQKIENLKYTKCAITKQAIAILTSNIDAKNYTKLPYTCENEYFYTTILALYQKEYLEKINKDVKQDTIKDITNLLKNVWETNITDDELGSTLYNKCIETFEIDKEYKKTQEKFDILYKSLNIDKIKQANNIVVLVLAISLSLNILNLILLVIGGK